MQMLQVQIGQSFPVILCCLQDGTVAFAKVHNFSPVWDMPEDGQIGAYFSPLTIWVFEPQGAEIQLEYSTTYRYKEMPLLLKWLQQQKLQQ